MSDWEPSFQCRSCNLCGLVQLWENRPHPDYPKHMHIHQFRVKPGQPEFISDTYCSTACSRIADEAVRTAARIRAEGKARILAAREVVCGQA